eukprot:42399-Chlamydomonas_euryale.AAC.1
MPGQGWVWVHSHAQGLGENADADEGEVEPAALLGQPPVIHNIIHHAVYDAAPTSRQNTHSPSPARTLLLAHCRAQRCPSFPHFFP